MKLHDPCSQTILSYILAHAAKLFLVVYGTTTEVKTNKCTSITHVLKLFFILCAMYVIVAVLHKSLSQFFN